MEPRCVDVSLCLCALVTFPSVSVSPVFVTCISCNLFSDCLSVSLPVSLCLAVFACLCHCLCLSVCLSVCLPVPVCVSFSSSLSLSFFYPHPLPFIPIAISAFQILPYSFSLFIFYREFSICDVYNIFANYFACVRVLYMYTVCIPEMSLWNLKTRL